MSLKKIQLRHFPPGINLIIKQKNNKLINKELNLYGIQNVDGPQLSSYIQQNLIPQQQQIIKSNLLQFTNAIKKIHSKNTQKHSRKYESSSTISTHKQPLTTCCFSKYGDIFATASYDRTCKLWQTQTNSLITTLSGHMNAVFSIDISEFNNKRLITTGSLDKTIKIWGVNGKLFHKLIGHDGEVTRVEFNPNGQYILSSSMDGVIKVWDIQKGRKVIDLKGHDSQVVNFSHNYQGDQIISTGFNNTPIIFDLKNGQIIHKLEGQHSGETTCCKFQFTGEQCATAGTDKKCIIWDVGSGQPMQILQNHQKQILSLDFSPNGSKLATSSSDSSICLYNVNLGTLQHKLHGHQRQVNNIKFNFQGDFILSTGFDGIGRIWDSNTGENIDLLQGHSEQIYSCDISYYGDKLLTCSKDGKCIIWREKKIREE